MREAYREHVRRLIRERSQVLLHPAGPAAASARRSGAAARGTPVDGPRDEAAPLPAAAAASAGIAPGGAQAPEMMLRLPNSGPPQAPEMMLRLPRFGYSRDYYSCRGVLDRVCPLNRSTAFFLCPKDPPAQLLVTACYYIPFDKL